MRIVLRESVDATVCTGTLASGEIFVEQMLQHVNWITDIFIYPGGQNLTGLSERALSVWFEKEPAR